MASSQSSPSKHIVIVISSATAHQHTMDIFGLGVWIRAAWQNFDRAAVTGLLGNFIDVLCCYRWTPFLLAVIVSHLNVSLGMLQVAAWIITAFFAFVALDHNVQHYVLKGKEATDEILDIIAYSVGSVLIAFKGTSPYLSHELPLNAGVISFYLNFLGKVITCVVKIAIVMLASTSKQQTGRILECVEFFSQFFGCLLPILPWVYFFSNAFQFEFTFIDFLCAVLLLSYGNMKVRELYPISIDCMESLRNVRMGSYGIGLDASDVEKNCVCAICLQNVLQPMKLTCFHIYCSSCIDLWLDKENTCPMCRVVVKNSKWTNGETSRYICCC